MHNSPGITGKSDGVFPSGLSALRHGQALAALGGRAPARLCRLLAEGVFARPPSTSPCAPMPACARGSLKVRACRCRSRNSTNWSRSCALVAGKTLPAGSLTYGIFSGERERLCARRRHADLRGGDRAPDRLQCPVGDGRSNSTASREQVTHLGLVMVDPDVQGQGLSWVLYGLTTLVLFARDGLRPKWISNVTQVPARVRHGLRDLSGRVSVAACRAARQSFAHLQLARGIMRDAPRGVRRRRRRPVSTRHASSSPMPIPADRTRSKKDVRCRAKTSRRAIQCVLRPRARLCQGRRCAPARPHRSRRRAPLSAARGAARLAAGAAGGFRRAGAAAVGAARRFTGSTIRAPSAACGREMPEERPMTPGVISRFHRQSLRRDRRSASRWWRCIGAIREAR